MTFQYNKDVTVKAPKNHVSEKVISHREGGFFNPPLMGNYSKNEKAYMESIEESNRIENERLESKQRVCNATSHRNLFNHNISSIKESLYKEGREKIFKSVMTRTFLESLVLPEDYIAANIENIAHMCESYFDGKYDLLIKHKNDNVFLQEVYKICESNALEIAKEQTDACYNLNDAKVMRFEPTDEQKNKIIDDMKDLNASMVGNMVKNKVLFVVKDEQERNKSRQELQDKINDKVEELQSKNLECFTSIINPTKNPFEPEYSLFESLMFRTQKGLLESVVTMASKPIADCNLYSDQLEDEAPEKKSYDDINNDIKSVNKLDDEMHKAKSASETDVDDVEIDPDDLFEEEDISSKEPHELIEYEEDNDVGRYDETPYDSSEDGNDLDSSYEEAYATDHYAPADECENCGKSLHSKREKERGYCDECAKIGHNRSTVKEASAVPSKDQLKSTDICDECGRPLKDRHEMKSGLCCRCAKKTYNKLAEACEAKKCESKCGTKEACGSKKTEACSGNKCESKCGTKEDCGSKKGVEEMLNVKQRIHKRAKIFKNKILKSGLKRPFRESIEPNSVDMDQVFIESITEYTLYELSHTINLESFDTNNIKKTIIKNIKK